METPRGPAGQPAATRPLGEAQPGAAARVAASPPRHPRPLSGGADTWDPRTAGYSSPPRRAGEAARCSSPVLTPRQRPTAPSLPRHPAALLRASSPLLRPALLTAIPRRASPCSAGITDVSAAPFVPFPPLRFPLARTSRRIGCATPTRTSRGGGLAPMAPVAAMGQPRLRGAGERLGRSVRGGRRRAVREREEGKKGGKKEGCAPRPRPPPARPLGLRRFGWSPALPARRRAERVALAWRAARRALGGRARPACWPARPLGRAESGGVGPRLGKKAASPLWAGPSRKGAHAIFGGGN
ncbi:hypothetical protein BS78_K080200 [Paspalum vaginatum]|uniref:Uncharacterized protein n=1 Tax=Paspalum vaginatum TaxID=158149 RepID=A0A9W7X888_9POAL|nr:hypothetical protein BS78_K080200 [Paspalum vaginatum]